MNKLMVAVFFLLSFAIRCEEVVVTDTTLPEEEKYLGRTKLKSTTIEVDSKAKVYVPLQIVSDVEIKALVVDNREISVPFDIEFNKAPERNGLYEVSFSEEQIDIDKDGTLDTFIHSPKKVTGKVLTGNRVDIKGAGISKEGTHKKRVYMTVEVKEDI